MKTMILTLEPPPPSPNTVIRWHWRKRARLFRDTAWQVYCALLQTPKGQFKTNIQYRSEYKPIRISGTRFHKLGKALDPDNLIGSLKPVIDGLVKSGLIPDDTDEFVTLGEFTQRSFGGKPHLELRIEQK